MISDSLVDAYVAIDEPNTKMLLTGKVARASDVANAQTSEPQASGLSRNIDYLSLQRPHVFLT
jgi:hypothetical protein